MCPSIFCINTSGERKQCQHETAKWDDSQQNFNKRLRDTRQAQRDSRIVPGSERSLDMDLIMLYTSRSHQNFGTQNLLSRGLEETSSKSISKSRRDLLCSSAQRESHPCKMTCPSLQQQRKRFPEQRAVNFALHAFGRFPVTQKPGRFSPWRSKHALIRRHKFRPDMTDNALERFELPLPRTFRSGC